MIQISILIHFNLSRYSLQTLGLDPRGFIYTSAVHLYLRSIFTAGAAGSWFYGVVPLFITLLDYELREISPQCIIHISILIVYNLSRYSLQTSLGIRLHWGLDPRGFIYTSAVHLYLRSIFTAGVPGSWFYVLLRSSTLYIPLDYELREISLQCIIHISILIVYNLERSSLQTWDQTRAGLYILPPSIFTYGPFLRRGCPGSGFTCSCVLPLFISPWIMNSERFHFNVLYILVFYQYSISILIVF